MKKYEVIALTERDGDEEGVLLWFKDQSGDVYWYSLDTGEYGREFGEDEESLPTLFQQNDWYVVTGPAEIRNELENLGYEFSCPIDGPQEAPLFYGNDSIDTVVIEDGQMFIY